MGTFIDLLEGIAHSDEKCVLATIIHIEGSAYLKEGTSMIIYGDGKYVGMLSASCLEEDVIIRAKEVFKNECLQTIMYDMRKEDDLSWGQGAGCNGMIYILLEFVTERLKDELMFTKERLERGKSILYKKEFSYQLSLLNDSFIETDIGEVKKNGLFIDEANRGLQYRCFYTPKPRMIIFGAGPDANPLVSLAFQADFHIILADWRPASINKQSFPEAKEFIIGTPEEIAAQIAFLETDFVIVMSHNFLKDQQFLNRVIDKKWRYLGILGPKERTMRLFNKKHIPGSVSSPAGLSIGAKGPNEIAISIMAEVIQKLRMSERKSVENDFK
ncbi:XdhC family protein [Metabacillus fastidiosus]|uniref:XdhC family protein n=1 Tax=Metabacillus fastidiosus TaxID=1458 RepID=UPI00082677B9|nr:XdhC family protein [Metabacillus fastidiosus]MED4461998.1 XdhC family protein [Metabacillus fastidiosus]